MNTSVRPCYRGTKNSNLDRKRERSHEPVLAPSQILAAPDQHSQADLSPQEDGDDLNNGGAHSDWDARSVIEDAGPTTRRKERQYQET